jgi:thiosulfate dehydrogenase
MSVKNCSVLTILIGYFVISSIQSCNTKHEEITKVAPEPLWHGWNKYQIKPEDSLIRYGEDIIENTAYYFGPKGVIGHLNMGMNCQNCHLEGGTLPWANNFSGVVSSYPMYMDRSRHYETIRERVNDCFQRSLNGITIDTTSREMNAVVAYIHWLGDDVPKGKRPPGVGIMALPYLNRAADTAKGRQVYINTCQRCHGADGQGLKNLEGYGFTYPPLWGPNSFNSGASFTRVPKMAGYVKNNMPFKEVTYENPKLTDEEAWDVAAYVCSQPRPAFDISKDWPDLKKKPIDMPFGPYADSFPQMQHKYGPYKPIKSALSMK